MKKQIKNSCNLYLQGKTKNGALKISFSINVIMYFILIFLCLKNIFAQDIIYPPYYNYLKEKNNNTSLAIMKADSFIITNPPDTIQQKSNKHFQRFKWFWQNRTTNNAAANPMGAAMNKYWQDINTWCGTIGNKVEGKWNNIGPNNMLVTYNNSYNYQGSGHIAAIWVNPNNESHILAGSNSCGLWQTTNNGISWQCLTDNARFPGMGITSIAVDPNNSNKIWFTTGIRAFNFSTGYGLGIFYSTDGGITWAQDNAFYSILYPNGINEAYNNETTTSCIAFKPGSSSIMFATFRNKIYKSINGGSTWSLNYTYLDPYNIIQNNIASAGFQLFDIEFMPNDPNKIFINGIDNYYLGGDGGTCVLYSSDGGTTWTNLCANNTFPQAPSMITNGDFSNNLNAWCTNKIPANAAGDMVIDNTSGNNRFQLNNAVLNTQYQLVCTTNASCVNMPVNLKFNAFIPNGYTLKIRQKYGSCSANNYGTDYTVSANSSNTYNINIVLNTWDAKIVFEVTRNNTNQTSSFWIDNIQAFSKHLEITNVSPYTSDKAKILMTYRSNNFVSIIADYSTTTNTFDNVKMVSNGNLIGLSPVTVDYRYSFEVNKNNPNIMYIGTIQMYKSINGGGNFTSISSYNGVYQSGNFTHADVRCVRLFGSSSNGTSDHIFMGNDGGISKSSDGAQSSWLTLNGKDLIVTQVEGFGQNEKDFSQINYGAWDNGINYRKENQWYYKQPGDGFKMASSNGIENDAFVYGAYSGGGSSSNFKKYTMGGSIAATDVAKPSQNSNVLSNNLNTPIHFNKVNNNLYTATDEVYKADASGAFLISNKLTNKSDLVNIFQNLGIDASLVPIVSYFVSDNDNIVYYVTKPYAGISSKLLKSTLNPSTGTYTPSDKTGTLPVNNWIISSVEANPDNTQQVWVGLGQVVWNPADVNNQNVNRVFYSADGGNTWQDKSVGLPWLPINKLLYIRGSDDIVFAATDAGVFMWNKQQDKWECFNNNLPTCIVSDIDYNYCGGTLRLSTWGKGIWETFIYKLSPYNSTVIGDGINTTAVTWNNSTLPTTQRVRKSDIIIKKKATLTISGINLYFYAGRRIIVEAGGKLVVNNSILTNECRALWGGIEVQGDVNKSQSLSYQGQVIIQNNSKIQYAYIGVVAGKIGDWDSPGITTDDYTKTGGIISVSNSEIYNCNIGAQFYPYAAYNSISSFTNTRFYMDDNNLDKYFRTFVKLDGIKNVKLTACNFENNRTNYINNEQNGVGIGYGIMACSSTFVVDRSTSNIRSKFIGLEHGIHSACSNNTFQVKYSDFEKCGISIYSENTFNPLVWYCTFKVGDNTNLTSFGGYNNNLGGNSMPFEAISLVQPSGNIIIEENIINGFNTASCQSIGTRVRSMGGLYNQIYRNILQNLTFAQLANNINRDINNSSLGLTYICNTHNNNIQDIVLAHNPANSSNGIKPISGSNTISAGNTFSTTASSPFGHINNDGTNNYFNLTYWGYGNGIYKPTKVNSNNTFVNSSSTNNTCPANDYFCEYGSCRISESSTMNINELEELYTNLQQQMMKESGKNNSMNPSENIFYQLNKTATQAIELIKDEKPSNYDEWFKWAARTGTVQCISDMLHNMLENKNIDECDIMLHIIKDKFPEIFEEINPSYTLHCKLIQASIIDRNSINANYKELSALLSDEAHLSSALWAKGILKNNGFPADYVAPILPKKNTAQSNMHEAKLDDLSMLELIQVHPNPASHSVSIHYVPKSKFKTESLTIRITDAKGTEKYKGVVNLYQTLFVDVQNLQNGIYIVQAIGAENTIMDTQKLIIQR